MAQFVGVRSRKLALPELRHDQQKIVFQGQFVPLIAVFLSVAARAMHHQHDRSVRREVYRSRQVHALLDSSGCLDFDTDFCGYRRDGHHEQHEQRQEWEKTRCQRKIFASWRYRTP